MTGPRDRELRSDRLRCMLGVALAAEIFVLSWQAGEATCGTIGDSGGCWTPSRGETPASRPAPRVARPEPRFEDFPVEAVFRGTPAALDLASYPGARVLKTRLRAALAAGPNFAGHYTVLTVNNGTDWQFSSIVDVTTGAVLVMGIESFGGVSRRVDSRLLIVDPPRKEEGVGTPDHRWIRGGVFDATQYYVMEGSTLRLIAAYDETVGEVTYRSGDEQVNR